jgi:hypothetical protein
MARNGNLLAHMNEGSSIATEVEVSGVSSDQTRMFTMFAGFVMAFYGVYRRDRLGTLAAMAGAGLAYATLISEVGHETAQGLFGKPSTESRTAA